MTFCPATMCPLFAADGSPWTGDKNATCPRRHSMERSEGCAWFTDGDGCQGCVAAMEQVAEAAEGIRVLQIGSGARRQTRTASKTYDCPRAEECQWQSEMDRGDLCPPRRALAEGLDPRIVAW